MSCIDPADLIPALIMLGVYPAAAGGGVAEVIVQDTEPDAATTTEWIWIQDTTPGKAHIRLKGTGGTYRWWRIARGV